MSPAGFKALLFLALLIPIALINRFVLRGPNHHYTFSYVVGSAVAMILIAFVQALSMPGLRENAFIMALGIIVIILMWKFLFGPWQSNIKAAVLGAFIFWIAVHILQGQSIMERMATLLATVIALIPAVIWCVLFLHEHSKRLSVVILTFLAGMLSTVPILFYDYVVRHGYQLNFFLFRLTPENFMRSSKTFVAQSLTGQMGVVSESVMVTIVSFALVGVIEEWSKHWVTRKSDPAYFSSINDVMQLSIIAAIGFAFAENVINPNYFIAFVKDYLVTPVHPLWGTFLASVFGRSVITNMVHITCSGILGYEYGLAFFARPVMEDDRARGRRHPLLALLHRMLRVSRVKLFRNLHMFQGLLYAMVLHSMFDILVSLPDVLSWHPNTIGELLGIGGPLSSINLILIPSGIYVFGGWFLLSYLFHRREGIQEFGYKLQEEVFVRGAATQVD
jgi:hypothetical protein